MRISDWSSDVCSSDLVVSFGVARDHAPVGDGVDDDRPADAPRGGSPGVRVDDAGVERQGEVCVAIGRRLEKEAEGGELRLRKIVEPEGRERSEEHKSELQSLMRLSYAVFFLTQQLKS